MPLQHHLTIPGLGPYLGSTLTFISDYSTIWILVIVISITIFITEITIQQQQIFSTRLSLAVAASINLLLMIPLHLHAHFIYATIRHRYKLLALLQSKPFLKWRMV
jgi:hypothetical protein